MASFKYIFICILLSFSSVSIALDCVVLDSKQKIKNAKDIFIGEASKVLSSKKIDNDIPWDAEYQHIVRLEVIENIRGKERKHQDVIFSEEVKVGDQFLIFDNSANTSMCEFSESTKLEYAGWHLGILGYESATYNKALHRTSQ